MLFRTLCYAALGLIYFPTAWASSYYQVTQGLDAKEATSKFNQRTSYGKLRLLGADNESVCRHVVDNIVGRGDHGPSSKASWPLGGSNSETWSKVGGGWVEYLFVSSSGSGRHLYKVKNIVGDNEVHRLYMLKRSIHADESLLDQQSSVCMRMEPRSDCRSPDTLIKYAINAAIESKDEDFFDGPIDLIREATRDDDSERMIYSKIERKALRNVGRFGGVQWQVYEAEGDYFAVSFPVSGFALPESMIFKLGQFIDLKCVAAPSEWN